MRIGKALQPVDINSQPDRIVSGNKEKPMTNDQIAAAIKAVRREQGR